jgi:ABC-type branched-subunit amino acid transport system ATPase component
VPKVVRDFLDRLGGRAPEPAVVGAVRAPATVTARPGAPGPTAGGDRTGGHERSGIEVRDLSVRFGGVRAVDGLTMAAPADAITGLIGPNGAGKTTTFAACCGLVHPSSGTVTLHGSDVSHLGPAARARRGLGRTFQRVEIFGSLSVRENIALGREAAMAGGNPLAHVVGRPGQGAQIGTSVEDALELVGIGHLSGQQAGLLPIGQRRLVEVARVLAGGFDMLLLDEPSSGLTTDETEHLGDVLLEVVRSGRAGVLLVEHDMALVRRLCDWIYVLDFGRLIFQGTSDDIVNSEVVRAAYLGSEAQVLSEAAAQGEEDPAPAAAPAGAE